MKATSLLLLSSLAYVHSLSSQRSDLSGNCLNCINSGFDFCSIGTALGPIDPINGVCC